MCDTYRLDIDKVLNLLFQYDYYYHIIYQQLSKEPVPSNPSSAESTWGQEERADETINYLYYWYLYINQSDQAKAINIQLTQPICQQQYYFDLIKQHFIDYSLGIDSNKY